MSKIIKIHDAPQLAALRTAKACKRLGLDPYFPGMLKYATYTMDKLLLTKFPNEIFGTAKLPISYLLLSEHDPLFIKYTEAPNALKTRTPFTRLIEICAREAGTTNEQYAYRKFELLLDYLVARNISIEDRAWNIAWPYAGDFSQNIVKQVAKHPYWVKNGDHMRQLKIFLPNLPEELEPEYIKTIQYLGSGTLTKAFSKTDNTMDIPDFAYGEVYTPKTFADTLVPAAASAYQSALKQKGKARIALLVEACRMQQDFTPLDETIGEIDRQGDDLVRELPQAVGEAFDVLNTSFAVTRDMTNAVKPGSYPYVVPAPKPVGLIAKFKAHVGLMPKMVPASKLPQLSPTQQYELTTKTLREGIDKFTVAKNTLRRHNERGRSQAKALVELADDIQDYLNDPSYESILADDIMLAKELQNHSESLRENAKLMELCAQTAAHTSERVTDVGQELNRTLKVVNVNMTIHAAGQLPEAEATARSLASMQTKLLKAAREVMTELVLTADLSRDLNPERTQKRIAESEALKDELARLLAPAPVSSKPSTGNP